jgi:SAM domain (Sterile alpha motif)
MSQKLTDAMNKLTVEGSRHSLGIIGRPPPSPGAKRLSGLDPSIINSMFPDAAAAIAKQKEQFTATTGMAPSTRNSIIGDRNSLVMTNRDSLIAPTISAPPEENKKDSISGPPGGAWGQRAQDAQRPKSSSSQAPMGQFTQPPPSAGLRSPRPHLSGDTNLQHTTLTAADPTGLSLLSPYPGGSWASMMNTPMTATFNTQQPGNQADIANATAMKLAALSTVNNRIQFDDVRKYRRTRSTDQTGGPASPLPLNFTLNATNEHGQMLTPQQIAALQAQQAQQIAALQARNRSRPNSPGLFVSGAPQLGTMPLLHTPQNAQFLSAFDSSPFNAATMLGGGMAHGSALAEGYASDHAEMHVRGRSPRGRRGSSKPPEDPTDMTLLQDIPAWLRSLRLHKYTDQLKDLKWQELVELDDEGLEKRGVAAKGARTKMLKVCRCLPLSVTS